MTAFGTFPPPASPKTKTQRKRYRRSYGLISDEATPLVIDTAKSFISLIKQIAPGWQKAYLRFSEWDSISEAKASYVHPAGVEIIDVLQHKKFFQSISQSGGVLLASLGKPEGIFLLIVDSSFDYEIKFEYEDRSKWRISKIGGGGGIPEGL